MIARQARVSVAVMRRWEPHGPGRSCLFHTITHYVTKQTNSQNDGPTAAVHLVLFDEVGEGIEQHI
jgi:hypothetical protein